jgi:hypothetical protein
MDEMIGYIFGSLRSSDNAVKGIGKTLKKQEIINRKTTFSILILAAYTTVVAMHYHEQNEKIKSLKKEINDLKEPKYGNCDNTEGE